MDISPGYQQTDAGVIPWAWRVARLGSLLAAPPAYGINAPSIPYDSRYPTYLRITDISEDGRFIDETKTSVGHKLAANYTLGKGDLVFARTGASVGKSYLYDSDDGVLVFAGFLIRIRPDVEKLEPAYLKYFVQCRAYWNWVTANSMRSGQPGINGQEYASLPIPLPPTKAEQEAIAEALSDADALIESLEQLLAKKRHLKQGAMQELLTGKKRLPGFSGAWEVKCIADIADCLDNLRVPLNDGQRSKLRGDYPYCGANGILDYIDRYCVDDSVILMAEDGGYFDEYMFRPIAYRMFGKFWVNNHAHVLKTKPGYDQDYLFYSLVHKNILAFLASGTRAKLNKSELNKITIHQPAQEAEQTAIATILSDMDADIATMEAKLAKARHLKQGMMQELLTGRIRLP